MKRLIKSRFWLTAVLIMVYLCGLAAGVFMTAGYSLYQKQRPSLFRHAHRLEQEYLEESGDYLHSLAGLTMRIFLFDTEGNCREQIQPDASFSPPELDALLKQELESALSGKETFHLTHAKETQFHPTHFWLVTSIPIKDHDSIAGAVVLIKHMEYIQGAIIGFLIYFTLLYWLSAFLLVSTMRKRQKLDELRQKYLDNNTHALKSPIASVKALTETLCDNKQPDPDQQKVYYGMILRENNKQEHMVRDVLELSKLQNHGMDFTKEAIGANAIFDQLLEKYDTLCECADISLHIDEKLGGLPTLYTNGACILQVLELLIDNALKFVSEGGDIWLEASPSRNKVTFCVRDNGVGISKEDLPHIFERFYKSNSKLNESGNGLGLAIAKEIMNGLREKIWAESEPGEGSAFYFTVHTK